MTKRIIALMAVATIVFVCTFAACGKDEINVYADNKDFDFVTDENGQKVLSDDGEFIVYVTDEKGKRVTDSNKEEQTMFEQFVPLENDGVVENYGYIFTLPEGWKTDTADAGKFINKDKEAEASIGVVKYFYDDYYQLNKDTYETLKKELGEDAVKWEEEVDILPEAEKTCRFIMEKDGAMSILVFFENSGNVYKILYNTTSVDSGVYDCEIFCKAITFKAFQYYDDITAADKD
ncbi:MAG: hypothetical protein J6K49_05110 [Clostridia bacterium]|nr:hypothetical protein [Clostridia bacterium]MBP3560026.1 hypothetical protein [Clostridia bacterium]